MQVNTGLYQGIDGFVMAYAVLSAEAPDHPNLAKIKFGYKRSSQSEYGMLTGRMHTNREWRIRIEGLVPGAEYNFVAYAENAHGLLSQDNNPTQTCTMPGKNQLPSGLATESYVDSAIEILGAYIDSQDEKIGLPSPTELTIASGAITVTGTHKFRYHSIDTEADAAADDLDTISGGNAGDLLLIQAEDAARVVTLKDGTGLKMEGDFTLYSTEDKILFINIFSAWHEITRSKAEGFPYPTELTIASGVITVAGSQKFRFHNIDTEGDAATDDLDTISGGNAGEVLILQPETDAREVTCKDGTNLKLTGDFIMNSTEDKIQLICIASGLWHELTRSDNG